MTEDYSVEPGGDKRFVISKLDPFLNKRHPDPVVRAVLAMGCQVLSIDEIVTPKPAANPTKRRTRRNK